MENKSCFCPLFCRLTGAQDQTPEATAPIFLHKKTEQITFGKLCLQLSPDERSCPVKASAVIPSSSLAEVWSAQTWTLGTLFTHIIVTCKPPCRKHKIHLYVLNLQAMTAQREQGEKDRRRKIKEKSRRCEAGPCSQRQKSRDSWLQTHSGFCGDQWFFVRTMPGLSTWAFDCRGAGFSPLRFGWVKGGQKDRGVV